MKQVVLVVMLVVVAALVAGWKWNGPKTQSGGAAALSSLVSPGPAMSADGWSWGESGE